MKLTVAILLVAATSAYGRTRVVNNNPANTSSPCNTALYSTIGAAITAANPGDTVQVCPSTYPEAVYINKANLKLTGLNIDGSTLIELLPTAGIISTDVNASAENPTENVILLVDSVSGVAITNISVNGSLATNAGATGNAGIYFRNASGSVTHSAVSYIGLNVDGTVTGIQQGHGIYIDSATDGAASVTVTGTSIHDFNKSGIEAAFSGAVLVAKNNAITGTGPTATTAQNGVEVLYGAKGTVNSNVVSSVDYTPSSTAATGILFYQASDDGEANDNVISESNNGVYFYLSNHNQAERNNISKMFNWVAVVALQSDSNVIEHNIISRAGLEIDEPAIYICGSKNLIEDNTINEAPIGVQIDNTGSNCTGGTGNTINGNVYYSVGVIRQTLTNPGPLDGADTNARAIAATRQHEVPKASPSK